MEDVSALAVGCIVGLLVIGVVNAFPGEPFDYDKGFVPPSNAPSDASSTVSKSRVARAREVDLAASQLKVQKLQELLGLEKSEVQKMIDQAKADAINGRQPPAPVNYSKWLDMVFYGVVLALMVVVLRAEYSVDVFQLLASWFPREAETVNKVATVLRSPVIWWGSWNS